MSISNTAASALKRMHAGMFHDPVRDWLVLLSTALIVLAGMVVWNAWAFDTVASGGIIGTPETSPASALDQSSLEDIRRVFADRAAEKAKYATGVYRYDDPSQ